MAAREFFPAPTIWPMLTGTSLYVGRGDTTVPFGKPEEVRYLQCVSRDTTTNWIEGMPKLTQILMEGRRRLRGTECMLRRLQSCRICWMRLGLLRRTS
jgi:hypothetical protein